VCGHVRPHPHVLSYDNACDAICNGCEAVREVPDHVYDNACDKDCNVCGAEREVEAHVYGEWSEKTAAVCDTPGVEARYCTICNHEDTREFGDVWNYHEWVLDYAIAGRPNDGHYTCKNCGKTAVISGENTNP
jgi:hypothetical protein